MRRRYKVSSGYGVVHLDFEMWTIANGIGDFALIEHRRKVTYDKPVSRTSESQKFPTS
jgi:hypothetical protein